MAKAKVKYRYRKKAKKKAYKRRKPMGMIGKTGVIVAAGVPIGFGVMDAISEGWRHFKTGNYGPVESLKVGAANFVDSLTCGFFGIKVFGVVKITDNMGASVDYPTNVSAPPTGWLYTTIVGAGLVGLDRFIGKYMLKQASRSVAGIRMLSG